MLITGRPQRWLLRASASQALWERRWYTTAMSRELGPFCVTAPLRNLARPAASAKTSGSITM